MGCLNKLEVVKPLIPRSRALRNAAHFRTVLYRADEIALT